MSAIVPIRWSSGCLVLLDQTRLPLEVVYETLTSAEEVRQAIQTMKTRGAPAIGIAAAYGLYLGVKEAREDSYDEFRRLLKEKADYLVTARPTAVNLSWALARLQDLVAANKNLPVARLKRLLLAEAVKIHQEDEEINKKIGENLLTLLKDGMAILTHCNAGILATSRYGTATAPLYLARERGWSFKVYAAETRPRLQGAALTVFELQQAGIDVTLITDNMAALVMSQGKIDAVIVGCDRVAANGDTANKIGTLGLSILAGYYGIPFYVAAPTPTVDLATATGAAIPIEERDCREITACFGVPTAPAGCKAYNPAFDITPHQNITAIVTDKGIIGPPYIENLRNALIT